MSKELFEHINKFAELDEGKFQKMLPYFELQKVKKKTVLMQSGERCKMQYFVVKGCLHMHFTDEKGMEHTVQFAIENWWISDYTAFHRQTPSEYSISAVEDSKILTLNHSIQEEFFQQFPEMEKYFRAIYQIAYGAATNRVKYIFNYSKEEIFFIFREHYPEFVNRVPQYMVASYLGLTPEYVSLLRKKTIS